ncbi:MAG: ribonuclease HII [Patescibacteria group bacterium]
MYKYIIGIDEVGRGALAGPVVVAAVAATTKFRIQSARRQTKLKIPLRDSKKLSANQREVWFAFIKKQKIPYAIARVSPKIIDKINISNTANLAATSALWALIKNYKLRIKNCRVYLDGGLYINSKFKNKNLKNIKTQTIIRGDEKIPAISLASIIAKVSRDRYMKNLHKKYPRYDFIHNVGYGTKKHVRAIKKRGLSPIHRRTFKI